MKTHDRKKDDKDLYSFSVINQNGLMCPRSNF
jgi:hypothetical protein